MLWRCAKIIVVIFAFCQLSANGRTGGMAAFAKTERAIRSITAIVDGDARSAFVGEVAKFADDEAFAIRKSQFHQDQRRFFIQLWRDDVNMVILNSDNDPKIFDCFFYQTGTEPVPDAVVDSLAKRLRRELGLIPGVVFEEKN